MSRARGIQDYGQSARELQNRSFAAPLPDLSRLPRVGDTPRMRVEWDTRDTMNNRLWSDLQVTGPLAVTSAALAAHPTGGAQITEPSLARQDVRGYSAAGFGASSYFPDTPAARPGALPSPTTLPSRSLFENQFTSSLDTDHNTAREFRGVVKEENRTRGEDVTSRTMERMFQHQWLSPQASTNVVLTQLEAAERLRPSMDDYRQKYDPGQPE